MYYSCIYEQCSAAGVLAPKIKQLTSFAMDLTNSDSDIKQLYGVRMLHGFLQREPHSRASLLSRLGTSTKTVHTLISMLGWESPEDAEIRLSAAKVIHDLAETIQVAAVPGSVHNISSLLGADDQLKRRSPLLCNYDSQHERWDTILDIGDDQEHGQDRPVVHVRIRQNSRILRCWQWMTRCCSDDQEEPSTDHDLLPVLGMSILEMLAGRDPENYAEISSATDLIPKIIGYTNEISREKTLKGSLKLLRRLSDAGGGETGVALRKRMSEHPFLLRNLAAILDDIEGSQEVRKLAAEILRNLAIDGSTREEIGCSRVIISRLIYAFLAPHALSEPYPDRSLQIVSGQALALLAMESVDNCTAMLKEPGYVKELTAMIQDDRCNRYVAASILRNLCLHARPRLSSSDLAELSHFLPKMLARIIETDDAGELEILISLSSQICTVLPEDFSRELEHSQIKEGFVKKLVKALNANMKPSAHFLGIRRAIVEQVLCMMELENSSSYASFFDKWRMMEVLSAVQETPSKVENYMLFFGDAGLLMEHSIELSDLVARTKEQLLRHEASAISSVN